MIGIYPRKNFVLIRILKEENAERKTKGGIIIPLTASQIGATNHLVGQIMSFGPDVKDLKEGNYVVFSKHAGNRVKDDTETEYVLIEEQQIFATCTT